MTRAKKSFSEQHGFHCTWRWNWASVQSHNPRSRYQRPNDSSGPC